MESIIEFKSSLDGRSYSCQYRRMYSESVGCDILTMVPGSLRWESLSSEENPHPDSGQAIYERFSRRVSIEASPME